MKSEQQASEAERKGEAGSRSRSADGESRSSRRTPPILSLQRSAGNRAVATEVARTPITVQRDVEALVRDRLPGVSEVQIAEAIVNLIKNPPGSSTESEEEEGGSESEGAVVDGTGKAKKGSGTDTDPTKALLSQPSLTGLKREDLLKRLEMLWEQNKDKPKGGAVGDDAALRKQIREEQAKLTYNTKVAQLDEQDANAAAAAPYTKQLQDRQKKAQYLKKKEELEQKLQGPSDEDKDLASLEQQVKQKTDKADRIKQIKDMEEELKEANVSGVEPTSDNRLNAMSPMRADARLNFLKSKRQEMLQWEQQEEDNESKFNQSSVNEMMQNESIANNPLFAQWAQTKKRQ